MIAWNKIKDERGMTIDENAGPVNQDEGGDDKLSLLLKRVDSSEIASIKGVVGGVVRIINDPNSNIKDLKDLILIDPPLSAKVLRVANSAYYASPREISEIDQAVVWIGLDSLQEIILTQKISEVFNNDVVKEGFSREHLWKHSLAVALLAKMIYRREFGEKGNNAYAAGLVHDIGVIVEDQLTPEDFLNVLRTAKKNNKQLAFVEKELLGYDHADIGRELALYWNFPKELAASIGYHHDHYLGESKYSQMAKTLYLADYLAFEQGYGIGIKMPLRKIVFENYCDDLKLMPNALAAIVKKMNDEFSKIEDKGVFET